MKYLYYFHKRCCKKWKEIDTALTINYHWYNEL